MCDPMRCNAHRDLGTHPTPLDHPCFDPRRYGLFLLLQSTLADARLYEPGMQISCRRRTAWWSRNQSTRRGSPGAAARCVGGGRPRSARGGGPQRAGVDAAEPRCPRVAGRLERCAYAVSSHQSFGALRRITEHCQVQCCCELLPSSSFQACSAHARACSEAIARHRTHTC